MLNRDNFAAYVKKMHQLNVKAAEEMQAYIDDFGFGNMSALVHQAQYLTTKYGEGTSELACLLYDYLAEHDRVKVPPAEPAPTATLDETWGAVQGALNESEKKVPDVVSRLVKQAGADTIQKNAARDRAEMAFVPVGQTCAFCMMLASRGWERATWADKSHAAHIHANCDCQYIVRFNPNEGVEGYDPDRYKKIYYNADPNGSWKDKLNAIRREQYAEQHRTKSITFDPKIADDQKQIISALKNQYESRLKEVSANQNRIVNNTSDTAGAVDISGEVMVLKNKSQSTAIHEFAHSIAMESSDKVGLSDNAEFWKEIKRIRRDYRKEMKQSLGDPRKQISFYEWTSGSIDEFMAEAFAHAKMKEMGIAIPAEYGKDFTYSKKVLAAVNKFFGKKR